jgi:DNA-binding MarR family transcriptional regulator
VVVSEKDALVSGFVGSVQVFLAAVSAVIEQRLLRDGPGKPLTLSQIRVLALLAHTEARTVGEVAGFLSISDAAASKAVDKLVRRRIVRRSEGVSDRRASELALTETGRKALREYERFRDRELSEVFDEIPAVEVQRVSELLDRLSARIASHAERPEEICLQCGIHLNKRCLMKEAGRADCAWLQRRNKSKARTHVSNQQSSRADNEVPEGGRPRLGPRGE